MKTKTPLTGPVQSLDIAANRRAQKWTRRELAGRVLWASIQPLFRWSPRMFWGWRRMLLSLFGAQVGKQVHVYPTVRIAIPWNLDIGAFTAIGDRVQLYSLGRIQVGASVTISQNAHLCAGTHDHSRPDMPLVRPAIYIQDGAWVCADAFVGPGLTIGEQAIVGARAVVMKDVASNTIVAGNPANVIGVRRRFSE